MMVDFHFTGMSETAMETYMKVMEEEKEVRFFNISTYISLFFKKKLIYLYSKFNNCLCFKENQYILFINLLIFFLI